MPPTEEEIAAEVAFVHEDMHWRQAHAPSKTGEADSKKNLDNVAKVLRLLMLGQGVTYAPKDKPPVTLFVGRCITRNDNLKALREEANKIVSKCKVLPPGAIFDSSKGWTIDTQLGIWRKAKMRALKLKDDDQEPTSAEPSSAAEAIEQEVGAVFAALENRGNSRGEDPIDEEDESETESGAAREPAPERPKPNNLTKEQDVEWERAVKKRKRADETLDLIEAAARQKATKQDVIDRFLHKPASAILPPVDTYDHGSKSGLYFNIPCLVGGGAFDKLREDTFNGKLGQTWRGWKARAQEHGNGDMGYENLHWVPDPTPCSNEKEEERFLKSVEAYALHLLTEQGYKRTGSTREDFTFPTAEERKTKTLEAMQTAMDFWCAWRTESDA